jgi:DNA-binding transcriptional LysR family regulator
VDNRISLRKLEIFRLVAERSSVSQAARTLHLAQPAVSEHIRTLEGRVGHKLFDRRGHGLVLTQAGDMLYACTTEVLNRAHELERELSGLTDGSVGSAVVGASTTIGSYLLPDLVAQFALQRVNARISLRTSVISTAIAGVRDGSLDFGIVVAPSSMRETDVEAALLLDEPYVLIAGGPTTDVPERITLAEIEELRFVCSPRDSPRLDLIDQPLEALGVRRTVTVELMHPEAIKRAVQHGFGVAFLLRSAIERELADGSVREIEVKGLRLTAPVYEIHRKEKRFSPLQRELVSAISEALCGRAESLGATG